ncbi:MAG: hypothetical protein JWQ90_4571 [Hydrocarboniphaga sp.]|uniref:hypothetical protein n=1 Tax=Hydrocarboniphaga sp. TaxID=2033016 RepID=UPI0026169DF8|nr:hypothetical protein [Hydrocarboniphaga sp.]MDB5972121.1 hypothetical protein [Hydrocarboniphaga sp.]
MKLSSRRIWCCCGLLLAIAAGVWLMTRAPAQHPDTAHFLQRRAGVELVDGYRSYSSVAEVGKALQARRLGASRRTLARPPDPRYPPHALDTLTVEQLALLDTQGRLSLQFFNDRLFEIDFKPDDAAACAAALKRADPQLQRDRNGRAEHSVGDRRLATNVGLASSHVGEYLGTEPYVLWQDLRLTRERDEWDRRFGALPYKMVE